MNKPGDRQLTLGTADGVLQGDRGQGLAAVNLSDDRVPGEADLGILERAGRP